MNAVEDPTIAGNVTLSDTLEDTPLVITEAQLLANSSDADSPISVTSATLGSGNGVLSAGPGAGVWTFTPDANWNGAVTIDFTVTGSNSDNAVASFNVTAVNDQPSVTVPTSGLPDRRT